MNDDMMKMMKISASGLCCSQIVLQCGLDFLGKENPDLIKAARGLCGGLSSGLVCGALSGGACLLTLLDCSRDTVSGLTDWFEKNNGTTLCSGIIASDPDARSRICPMLVYEVYRKVIEIYEEQNED